MGGLTGIIKKEVLDNLSLEQKAKVTKIYLLKGKNDAVKKALKYYLRNKTGF